MGLDKDMVERVAAEHKDEITCLLGTFRAQTMGESVNEEYLGIFFDPDTLNWLMHGVFTHTDTLVPFHVWSWGKTPRATMDVFNVAYGDRFANSQASIERIVRPESEANRKLRIEQRRLGGNMLDPWGG